MRRFVDFSINNSSSLERLDIGSKEGYLVENLYSAEKISHPKHTKNRAECQKLPKIK